MLPLRVGGLSRRWSVGLWQSEGWVQGTYGKDGRDRFSSLGIDDSNQSYVPLFVDRAPRTSVRVGHPLAAVGEQSESLFIQVTHVSEPPPHAAANDTNHVWHLSIQNPLESAVSVELRQPMQLPGMKRLHGQHVTIEAGGIVVL